MPAPSRVRVTRPELGVYLVLALVLLLATMLNQRGLFVPDIKPEVYLNPWQRLRLDLSTWLPSPYLGTQNYNLGLAPVDLLSGLLSGAGIPNELVVRVLRFGLFCLGGAGAVAFVRAAAPESDSPAARITAAVVYTLNPYSVVAGSTLAILLPYAVFPWFLLALTRAVSTRGWRRAAQAALLLAAMTGMNVGAVPALQLAIVPALLWWLLREGRTTARAVVAGLLRTGVLVAALSLYWLIPAFFAMGTASAVVDNSETLTAISQPSGWGEVLRGLGLWPMYGGTTAGPWQPGFTPYLQGTLVIVATFALVGLALVGAMVSRSPARLFGMAALLTVGAVMVGLHPPGGTSPFGLAMQWLLENVPGLMVVRTTNKAGAGLALAVTLLVALAAHELVALRRTVALRAGAAALAALVLLLATWPVWAGEWNVGRWQIPDYWRAASADLDEASQGRLWMVPGQVLAGYQWSTDSVDDVNVSLLGSRSSVLRTALPTQDAHASNLLYNADNQLQTYNLGPGATSSYARLLGVQQILLRSDVNWENGHGLPPGLVVQQLAADPGLTRTASYGRPGENVAGFGGPAGKGTLEPDLEPLIVYSVADAVPRVSARPVAGTVVVAGDAAGYQQARQSGLLPEGVPVVYAADVTAGSVNDLLGGSHRWVLTDSNRRTNVAGDTLQNSTSFLLGPDDPADTTRALGSAADQTTARYTGISGVRASAYGWSSHGIEGNPSLAVDDDPSSAWLTGPFGSATGQWLELTLAAPKALHEVTVRTATDSGVAIRELQVSFGGQTRTVPVRSDGTATVDLGGVEGDLLRVEITRTGPGDGYAGISDVALPGITIARSAQLPQTLDRLLADPAVDGALLGRTPIDVVMSRARSQAWFGPLEEANLARAFTLPRGRSYRAYGVATAAPGTGATRKLDRAGCLTVGTVDGKGLSVRPLDRKALRADKSWLFQSCDSVTLLAGSHELLADPDVVIDTITFRDRIGEALVSPSLAPEATVHIDDPDHLQLRVDNPSGLPMWLSTGMATDPGWRATIDGRDLGSPTAVDGYAMSWELRDTRSAVVDIEFRPQRWAELTRWVSLAALIACLGFALIGRRHPASLPRSRRAAPTRRRAALGTGAWTWLTLPAGPLGMIAGAVAALVVASGVLHRRGWFRVSLLAMALAPLAWILGNAPRWGTVTAALVYDNPAAGWLAWLALTSCAIGLAVGGSHAVVHRNPEPVAKPVPEPDPEPDPQLVPA